MRRKARVLLMVATCVIPTACLTGFKQPLGSVEEAFLEPGILGTWACSSVDDSKPSVLDIMDFDGKQYYIESSDGKGDPTHLRALGHRIEDVAFLSLQRAGKEGQGREWVFLQYALPDTIICRFAPWTRTPSRTSSMTLPA